MNTLTEKEKLEERESFLHSKNFGKHTFTTLLMFKVNSLGMLDNVILLGLVIDKLDDTKIFPHTFSKKRLVQSKQYLVLDGVVKLLTIIEGLFVLIHSLNEGYETVSKNMVRYPQNLVWKVIENISSKNYSIKKILALPSIDDLDISKDAKNNLNQIYQETSTLVYDVLMKLADFYSKFNIPYNKSKHGLSLEPTGFPANETNIDLEHSSLSALDHRENDKKMPSGYFVATVEDSSDSLWFNVESRILFNKKLISDINSIIGDLKIICNDIVENHLTYANNCGVGYLPVKQNEDKKYSISFLLPKSKINDYNELGEYLNKTILPNMVVSDFALHMNRSYTKEPIVKSLLENPITNIFLKPKNEVGIS